VAEQECGPQEVIFEIGKFLSKRNKIQEELSQNGERIPQNDKRTFFYLRKQIIKFNCGSREVFFQLGNNTPVNMQEADPDLDI
jgi:uncharacterized protein YeeX (DUF496 family)